MKIVFVKGRPLAEQDFAVSARQTNANNKTMTASRMIPVFASSRSRRKFQATGWRASTSPASAHNLVYAGRSIRVGSFYAVVALCRRPDADASLLVTTPGISSISRARG